MSTVGVDMPAIHSVPHLNCRIAAGRGDAFAIGRPGDHKNDVAMAFIDIDMSAIGSVPDLDYFIFASGGDAFATGRPGDCVYIIVVTTVGIEEIALRGGVECGCRAGC